MSVESMLATAIGGAASAGTAYLLNKTAKKAFTPSVSPMLQAPPPTPITIQLPQQQQQQAVDNAPPEPTPPPPPPTEPVSDTAALIRARSRQNRGGGGAVSNEDIVLTTAADRKKDIAVQRRTLLGA